MEVLTSLGMRQRNESLTPLPGAKTGLERQVIPQPAQGRLERVPGGSQVGRWLLPRFFRRRLQTSSLVPGHNVDGGLIITLSWSENNSSPIHNVGFPGILARPSFFGTARRIDNHPELVRKQFIPGLPAAVVLYPVVTATQRIACLRSKKGESTKANSALKCV